VEKVNEDADFITHVLWTDESHFTQMGVVKAQNRHYWAQENLHFISKREHQVHWSLSMWAGLLGDCIIGPYTLPEHLTTAAYCTLIDEAWKYCWRTFLWP
jgi:hypothetical protein